MKAASVARQSSTESITNYYDCWSFERNTKLKCQVSVTSKVRHCLDLGAYAVIDPRELFEKIANRYATCGSYRDEGRCVGADNPALLQLNIEFETFFVRPNKFRFGWKTLIPNTNIAYESNVLWSNGTDCYVKSLGRTEKCMDLSLAIAGATGISSGKSIEIAMLLGAANFSKFGISILTATNVEIKGHSTVLGDDCYRLECNRRKAKTNMWISSTDFSLRRIRENIHGDDMLGTLDGTLKEVLGTSNAGKIYGSVTGKLKRACPLPKIATDHCTDTTYRKVEFDVHIDDSVFSPPF